MKIRGAIATLALLQVFPVFIWVLPWLWSNPSRYAPIALALGCTITMFVFFTGLLLLYFRKAEL